MLKRKQANDKTHANTYHNLTCKIAESDSNQYIPAENHNSYFTSFGIGTHQE